MRAPGFAKRGGAAGCTGGAAGCTGGGGAYHFGELRAWILSFDAEWAQALYRRLRPGWLVCLWAIDTRWRRALGTAAPDDIKQIVLGFAEWRADWRPKTVPDSVWA